MGINENLLVIENENDFDSFKKHLDSMPDVGDSQMQNGRYISHSYKGIEGKGFYFCERSVGSIESIEIDYSNRTIKHIFSKNEDYLS
jgi:hypothetical protein